MEVSVYTDRQTTKTITTYADFLTDLDEIDRVMSQRLLERKLRYQKKTAADVLVHFLKFYRFEF